MTRPAQEAPCADKSTLSLRVGHLLFAGALIVAGLVLMGGVPINGTFGIRTSQTMAAPKVWAAVNSSAGLRMACWGWIGLSIVSLARMRLSLLVGYVTTTVGLLALPAVAPATFVELHTALQSHGLLWPQGTRQSFVEPLVTLVVIGSVGNVLCREFIGRNSLVGFRLRPLLESDEAWAKGNWAGGCALQAVAACGLLIAIGLQATGMGFQALVACLLTLVLSPLVACLAAISTTRT